MGCGILLITYQHINNQQCINPKYKQQSLINPTNACLRGSYDKS